MSEHGKPHGGGEGEKQPGLPHVDVTEHGGKKDGVAQTLNERLFMQLLVFGAREGADASSLVAKLGAALEKHGVGAVVYEDANDPRGVGVLTWSKDPTHFPGAVRAALNDPTLADLVLKPEYTMLGRTYSQGYEPELDFWLLRRSIEVVLDPASTWAVWYPLRRSGAFAKLPDHEQGIILKEHGTIGRAYGAQGLAHDVRLACFGIDKNDNEFVIGLVGKELHPLSHVVQTMRKTRQTSEFIVQMGPFFVGRAAWRSPGRS